MAFSDQFSEDAEKLTDEQLIKIIARHVDDGINSEEGGVSDVRQNMFNYYYGEPLGNERDGFSKYVSREVFEAIEWALPSILRVLLGGTKPVVFRPSSAEDEQLAKHETDVVNYWFTETNDAFINIYTFVKDILMNPNGYIGVYPDEIKDTETKSYTKANSEQIDTLEASEEITEVIIDREYDDPLIPGERLYDITVSRVITEQIIQVEPIPPDELIIKHGYNKLDLDKSPFTCHRRKKTMSDLIEMGYEPDELEGVLRHEDDDRWNDERVNRHFYIDENPDDEDDESNLLADRTVWLHTCYMRIDMDGDGLAELRKIVCAGTTILENEPADIVPYVAGSAIHVTHKHIGMGYAEAVHDLQELISVLTRQMLDNIYRQNVRRKYIAEQALLPDNSTMDQMLDGESEIVVTRGSPHEAIMPEQVQPITAELAQAVKDFKELPQMRTGVAPNLTLDPSVLEKSTMGAFIGALEQASQRLELMLRLFAETSYKKIFLKIHHYLRTYFTEQQQIKMNGQWVTYAPSEWRKRSNLSANIGIGFNNKQIKLGLLKEILAAQREAMSIGLADEKTIFNTFQEIIEEANLGHTETYFNNPNAPGFKKPDPKPDPQTILANAQAKSLQADAQHKAAKFKDDQQREQAKFKKDTERQEQESTIQIMEAEAKLEQLNQESQKIALELELMEAEVKSKIANLLADTELKNAQATKLLKDIEKMDDPSYDDEVHDAGNIIKNRESEQ